MLIPNAQQSNATVSPEKSESTTSPITDAQQSNATVSPAAILSPPAEAQKQTEAQAQPASGEIEKKLKALELELAQLKSENEAQALKSIPSELHDVVKGLDAATRGKIVEAFLKTQSSQPTPQTTQQPKPTAPQGLPPVNVPIDFATALSDPDKWARAKASDPDGARRFIQGAVSHGSMKSASHILNRN